MTHMSMPMTAPTFIRVGKSWGTYRGLIPEETKVAPPHCLSQLIVCLQGLAQPWLGEILVLWNLSQQQAYQNEPLADHNSEAKGAVGSLQSKAP